MGKLKNEFNLTEEIVDANRKAYRYVDNLMALEAAFSISTGDGKHNMTSPKVEDIAKRWGALIKEWNEFLQKYAPEISSRLAAILAASRSGRGLPVMPDALADLVDKLEK